MSTAKPLEGGAVTYPNELPGEDWRPLAPPYQDWLISSRGRVWSMRWEKLLAVTVEKKNSSRKFPRAAVRLPLDPTYPQHHAGRSSGGRYRYKQTTRGIGHAMLEAFVSPRPSPAHSAFPKDNDPANLAVENWEWAITNVRWRQIP